MKNLKGLNEQVIGSGRCISCGLCSTFCPYLCMQLDKARIIDSCDLEQGNCYNSCPRTFTDWDELNQHVFGRMSNDYTLGSYSAIYMARATEEQFGNSGQYGGVVTALLAYLLENKEIDSAVVALTDNESSKPIPHLASSREEILEGAGSKFGACPTLSVLTAERLSTYQGVGVVGRPCQILAVRKLQALKTHPVITSKLKVLIGLFCMWALDYSVYDYLYTKISAPIEKMDIPKGKVTLKTVNENVTLFVDEIRKYIRPGCQACFDPISEFADISVGSTEFDDKWNTLIVRTELGKSLIDQASSSGILEVKQFPTEKEQILREAVWAKKKRVLTEQKEMSDYVFISEEQRKGVIES